jgi:hypothetical protein
VAIGPLKRDDITGALVDGKGLGRVEKARETAKLLATHPGPVMAVFVHVRSWHYRGWAGDWFMSSNSIG